MRMLLEAVAVVRGSQGHLSKDRPTTGATHSMPIQWWKILVPVVLGVTLISSGSNCRILDEMTVLRIVVRGGRGR